jgi:hypothetical protein
MNITKIVSNTISKNKKLNEFVNNEDEYKRIKHNTHHLFFFRKKNK